MRTMTPRKIAGTPSTRKSHCHPASPNNPFRVKSAPDSGPPIRPLTGTAVMKCCNCARTLSLRIPMTQVINHTGKETRLRSAEQKPQHVKSVRGSNKQHRHRDSAPADHDAGDPTTRTDAV